MTMFRIVPKDLNIDLVGKRRTFGILSVILVIASIAAFFVIEPNYGIDFRGGTDMILKFEGEVTPEEVREAAREAGFPDANVQRFGTEGSSEFLVQTVEVSVVNAQKIKEVRAAIEGTGKLERLTWNENQPDRMDVIFGENVPESELRELITAQGLEEFDIEGQGMRDEGQSKYRVRFQDLGTRVRDGFAAAMGDKFDRSTGLERLETVGARVGQQLRDSAMLAILVALFLILLYIAFRFDARYAPGAVVALAHDVAISVGVFTVIQMEISLPIVAALLTIVGYSLNDTIVVFDRIRENLVAEGDADVEGTVNRSINETLSRTFITSLTTLLAVLAIFFFGGGLIKDFAFALIVGILVGTYSSVFVASPVMIFMDSYFRSRRESKRRAEASA